jgi:hypothetical protein
MPANRSASTHFPSMDIAGNSKPKSEAPIATMTLTVITTSTTANERFNRLTDRFVPCVIRVAGVCCNRA